MASTDSPSPSNSEKTGFSGKKASFALLYAAMAVMFVGATVLVTIGFVGHHEYEVFNRELVGLRKASAEFEKAAVNLVFVEFSEEGANRFREALTAFGNHVECEAWPVEFVTMHRGLQNRMDNLWIEIESLIADRALPGDFVLMEAYYRDSGPDGRYQVAGGLMDFATGGYFEFSDALIKVRNGLMSRHQRTTRLMTLGVFLYLGVLFLFFLRRGFKLVSRARRKSVELKSLADDRRKRLEEAQDLLLEREKSVTMGRMVAGVAHDVNSPLGICVTGVSYLESLAADAPGGSVDAGRLTEGLELVRHNLDRALDLIRGFKTVTADGIGDNPRPFDLVAYLEKDLLPSLRPTLRKRGHTVEFDPPDEVVMMDSPGMVAQIISNLVFNASFHAYESGKPGTVDVSLRTGDGFAEISVADAGKGMDGETVARIYDPFFTTNREKGGTGLGLAIVYNLVTLDLHGEIRCESEPGKGTVFTVSLPIPGGEGSRSVAQ